MRVNNIFKHICYIPLLSLSSCIGEKVKTNTGYVSPPSGSSSSTSNSADSFSSLDKALAPTQLSPVGNKTLNSASEDLTLTWIQPDANSTFLIRVKDLTDPNKRDSRNNCDYGVYLCIDNYKPIKSNGKYSIQVKVHANHKYLFWVHGARSDFDIKKPETYSASSSIEFTVNQATSNPSEPDNPQSSSSSSSSSVIPPPIHGPTKTPAWARRNEYGKIIVDSKSAQGTIAFDSEISFAYKKSGFPLGHNLGESIENKLFYNLKLDGYGGLPMGSCLKRGYLIPDSDPTKNICQANENVDLFRDWSQFYARNGEVTRFKNTLIKNVDVRNAFRTYNYVDGRVVKSSYDLPHTDTFQSYYGGAAGEKNSQWLVVQDSIIKNTDNGGMIVGDTHYKGFLYQNLEVGCDSAFIADGLKRIRNDYIRHGAVPAHEYVCTNHIGTSSYYYAPTWLIDIEFTNPLVRVVTNGAPVVVIGKNREKLNISFFGSTKPGEICLYPTVEDALNDKDVKDGCGNFERPPFLELSCAGWRNPPLNCETRRGYIP